MIEAVLFDLDDTLYLEVDYCSGGFAAAARRLAELEPGTPEGLAALLLRSHLEEGRERVFDRAAARFGFSRSLIPDLVRAYREHTPRLQFSKETLGVLQSLRASYKLGCVTDGHAEVQRAKIQSLRLDRELDAIVVADELGREAWKPAPTSLLECCRRLGVAPDRALFVGDNPERDMAAAAAAGMPSIRIRRPKAYFARVQAGAHLPAAEIESLADLSAVVEQLKEADRK